MLHKGKDHQHLQRMCGRVKIHMQFDLTISSDIFPSTYGIYF
jgi:hypothetical protein